MRLDELKGYKNIVNNITNMNRWDIETYLKAQGLKQINKGDFSQVWDFGNPRWILKIFFNDRAYISWISESISHKDNPYFPKFKGKLITVSHFTDYAGILLERLTPVDSVDYILLNSAMDIIIMVQNAGSIESAISSKSSFKSSVVDYIEYSDIIDQKDDYSYTTEELVNVVKIIMNDRNLIEITNVINEGNKIYHNDFQSRNTMKRGNQIVVTDPWVAR